MCGGQLDRSACHFSEVSRHFKVGENTKYDISHFCQFSQNFKQLRSTLNTDIGICVDR